jgi:hypothetical protein
MHNESYRRLGKAATPLLMFSCAVLLSLVFVRFVGIAQWRSFSYATERIARIRSVLSGKNGPETLKSRLLNLQDSLAGACASLSREYGDTKDLSGILRLLISKANAAQIQFVKMRPPSEAASGNVATYPLVLELTTSYQCLGRFVSSMESLPHLVRVDRIAITAVRNNMVEARILVTCFLYSNG